MTEHILPTFIIIGAMKCGTTSLHSYIDRHPDVSMSDPKEVDFFSGHNSDKPLDWYSAFFDPSKPVRGEASQNYSKAHHPLYKGAPERIKALIPDIKLIYLVRDPIERYFSHLQENYYVGSRADQRWSKDHDNYLLTSLYHYQLSFFLRHFSLNQIMVIDSRDLQNNRRNVMSDVFEFLGLSPLPNESFDYRANATATRIVPNFVRSTLPVRAANKIAPSLTEKLLTSKPVVNLFKSRPMLVRMKAGEKSRLMARFKTDADKLRELLNREFAHWSV